MDGLHFAHSAYLGLSSVSSISSSNLHSHLLGWESTHLQPTTLLITRGTRRSTHCSWFWHQVRQWQSAWVVNFPCWQVAVPTCLPFIIFSFILSFLLCWLSCWLAFAFCYSFFLYLVLVYLHLFFLLFLFLASLPSFLWIQFRTFMRILAGETYVMGGYLDCISLLCGGRHSVGRTGGVQRIISQRGKTEKKYHIWRNLDWQPDVKCIHATVYFGFTMTLISCLQVYIQWKIQIKYIINFSSYLLCYVSLLEHDALLISNSFLE